MVNNAEIMFAWGTAVLVINFLLLTESVNGHTDFSHISNQNDELCISAEEGRNVLLKSSGQGRITFNGLNVKERLLEVDTLDKQVKQLEKTKIPNLESVVKAVGTQVSAIDQGLDTLETDIIKTQERTQFSKKHVDNINQVQIPLLEEVLDTSADRIAILEQKIKNLIHLLSENHCRKLPCQNGGFCQNTLEGYLCTCLKGWKGKDCSEDIDECSGDPLLDDRCANDAVCTNLPGSFSCTCKPGFYGLHCKLTEDVCTPESSRELCGNGDCVTQPTVYFCICDAGYDNENGRLVLPCTADVNECEIFSTLCAKESTCINYPGSYMCAPCPEGYNGDGHNCQDIDECKFNNGGCSIDPYVFCINSPGSSRCGPCPAGYQGDGIECTYVGPCGFHNGGCHPLATCSDNPAVGPTFVECSCPSGYFGNGIGPEGCQPEPPDPCADRPCVYGECIPTPGGLDFTCRCLPSYTGKYCDTLIDFCASDPCLNGGMCFNSQYGYNCKCRPGFQGTNCEEAVLPCGGEINEEEGSFTFPADPSYPFPHNADCKWKIVTKFDKYLKLSFPIFHIEETMGCIADYVEVFDGGNEYSPSLGKWCGDVAIKNIFTTGNAAFIWAHSDNDMSSDGFQVKWTSLSSSCGGVITNTLEGNISSPDYPNNYPNNKDCFWFIHVKPNSRIQFEVEMDIEAQKDCAKDYLEILDGPYENSPALIKSCGVNSSMIIKSNGPDVVVHFHSDLTRQGKGFFMKFTSITGWPGCGGTLTDSEGEISAPVGSTAYSGVFNCKWVIDSHPHETIELVFKKIDIPDSGGCRENYVEVIDGESYGSANIGRYCGRPQVPLLRSSGSSLLVHFQGNSKATNVRFDASYRIVCGGIYSGDSGMIYSPYYPDSYPMKRTCLYKISVGSGNAVSLRVLQAAFGGSNSAPCDRNYLEVRDGDNNQSPILGKICGSISQPREFTSMTSHLLVTFQTTGVSTNKGFVAFFDAIKPGCGGIHTDPEGTIGWPEGAGDFEDSLRCTYVIDAPVGEVIILQFESMKLQDTAGCSGESLAVFNNTVTTEANLIGRFCGTRLPRPLTTSGSVMTVVFTPSSPETKSSFTATYRFIDENEVCGGYFYTSTGSITSPLYPEVYPVDLDCNWSVTVPNQARVVLEVQAFSIDKNFNCLYEYVEIRNGANSDSPLVGMYCGTSIPSRFPFHSSSFHLRFVSDSMLTSPGFSMKWFSEDTGCGGDIYSPEGSIISPNYPEPFHEDAVCEWGIHGNAPNRLLITFNAFDLPSDKECTQNYLEIYNGPNFDSYLKRLCGGTKPEAITSTDSSVSLRMRTSKNNGGTGFSLKFTTPCQEELFEQSGVIESPGFPESYLNNQRCSWTIVAPIGNKINITFQHFKLEQKYGDLCFDEVQVYEKDWYSEGSFQTELGAYCGDELPPPISSTQSAVIVRLFTDTSKSKAGFRLEWNVNGCGQNFVGQRNGSITSPNYPGLYPENLECRWYIQVKPGSQIMLSINKFDLEGHDNCTKDSLKIYSGKNNKAPLITTLCHKGENIIVASHGYEMYLELTSDKDTTGTGFFATFQEETNGCGGKFTSNQGTIQSASPYDPNEECPFLIETKTNQLIKLTFTKVSLGVGSCDTSNIKVFDGATEKSKLLDTVTQCAIPVHSILSSGNSLLVLFTSGPTPPGEGFEATYRTVCGAVLKEPSGSIQSPSFPHPDLAIDCIWKIQSENKAEKVTLIVTYFDIPESVECKDGYLAVYEGSQIEGDPIKQMCGKDPIFPVTSKGDALTIVLVNKAIADGVLFKADYITTTSGCGATVGGETGGITSPNYPSMYTNDLECIWSITSAQGAKYSLQLEDIDIQADDNCLKDFLEVREGTAGGKHLETVCGKKPTRIPDANGYWLKFSTDGSVVGKGFKLLYNLVDSNELVADSGIVESPLYPIAYHNTRNFEWKISLRSEGRIQLNFLEMDLETKSDSVTCVSYIQIHDGVGKEAPIIGKFCGYQPPETVIGSSKSLLIIFVSAPEKRSSKFRLSWSMVDSTGPEECGGSYYLEDWYKNGSTLEIASPGYPDSYTDKESCKWEVKTDPHMRMSFSVQDIDMKETTQCWQDELQVDEYIKRRWFKVGSYCKADDKGKTALTRGSLGRAFLKVMTEGNKSFKGIFKSECGSLIEDFPGMVYSPGFPNALPKDISCDWTFIGVNSRTVQIKFISFDLGSGSCENNFIEIYDGKNENSPSLKKCCPSGVCGDVVSTGPEMFVRFKSGAGEVGKGFQFEYQHPSLSCGGLVVLNEMVNSTTIESPGYPGDSPERVECEWIISGRRNRRYVIEFDDVFEFGTDCQKSYVELRDGGSVSSPLMGRFCGTSKPFPQHSSGSTVYIKYHYEAVAPQRGFRAFITEDICGGEYGPPSGIITSPNYPQQYAAGSDCEWLLYGTTGHYLDIKFLDMDVPGNTNCSDGDYVEIRNKHKAGTLLGIFCGNTKPQVKSEMNVVYVKFHTGKDSSGRGKGFRLAYNSSAFQCGGTLESQTGSILSPGYPNSYPGPLECVWLIKQKLGKAVKIILEVVNMVSEGNQCVDYVEILNGGYSDSPSIDKSCIINKEVQFDSTSNIVKVVFKSAASRPDKKGFRLRYQVKEIPSCGQLLTDHDSGANITSLGYPEMYRRNLECSWYVRRTNWEDSTVVFKFDSIDIEYCESCSCDVLETRTGVDNDIVIDRLCGKKDKVVLFYPYRGVDLRFKTNDQYQNSGFNGVFTINPCGGGGKLENKETIKYPSKEKYPPDMFCAWTYSSAPGTTIKVTFSVFDVENSTNCENDRLVIRNGRYPSSPIILTACGKDPPTEFITESNSIYMEFITNAEVNGDGFSLTLSVDEQGCGGVYHSESGVITAPSLNSLSETNCLWEIRVNPGYHLNLTFINRFSIPDDKDCSRNYLQIEELDVDSKWQNLTKKLCGKDAPPMIQSHTDDVRLRFVLTQKVDFDFQLSWVTQCGGILEIRKNNFFTSPGYPIQYPQSVTCKYFINKGALGHTIELKFEDYFDIARNLGSCNDKIFIYHGRYLNQSLVPTTGLCGTKRPEETFRANDEVMVEFTTNGDKFTGKGFKLSYIVTVPMFRCSDWVLLESKNLHMVTKDEGECQVGSTLSQPIELLVMTSQPSDGHHCAAVTLQVNKDRVHSLCDIPITMPTIVLYPEEVITLKRIDLEFRKKSQIIFIREERANLLDAESVTDLSNV